MTELLNLVLAGLATGSIYAIIAIGFALLWQTSQTINFAQGEFVMLPAFFMLVAIRHGVPYPLAVGLGIVAAMAILGFAFKRVLVDPMLKHGVLPLAIATMALSIFMKDSVKQFYGAEAYPFPSLVPDSTVVLLGVPLSMQRLAVFAAAILAVILLQLLLNRTTLGRQMQAAAQNPSVARILGIPVERMILLTFLINAVLVAVGSILITPDYGAKFSNGDTLGSYAFIAAIVGGFNQVRGAIAGGLLLGVISNFAAAYGLSTYRDAIPLILLIAVILFRPQGLFGRIEERTV